jgi:hypothetical protein
VDVRDVSDIDCAHSYVARRSPCVAAQPGVGLFPERWTRLAFAGRSCPAFDGQDLRNRSGP